MSKRTGSVVLVFLFAMLAFAVAGEPLAAQADAGKLKFEIYQDAAKEYRWRLKAANGAILATPGQGYKAKADCQNGIDRIKADAGADKLKFEVYEDKSKGFRWRLLAANGQVIAAASEGYKSKADCDRAIEVIKKGVAKADVEDQAK